jgi:hypothetical protein
MTAPADPRCTCGQVEHRQTCRVELERAQLAAATLQSALRRIREKHTGRRAWAGAGDALGWYFRQLRRRSTPRSARLEPANGRIGEDPVRRAAGDEQFAAVAFAVGEGERDARSRGEAAPVARWLAEHYALGRAYAWIAEEAGREEADVRRVMSRVHRVIRERLEDGGWLDE